GRAAGGGGGARAPAAQRAAGGSPRRGRAPPAASPAAVAVATPPCPGNPTPPGRPDRCALLVYLAAKGLGVGPNPDGPSPYLTTDDNTHSFQYLPNEVRGDVGVLRFPTDGQLHGMTPLASRQIVPTNLTGPPPDTPLRPGGPIQHVFYIVKENRTYDQVLGDLPRGDGDPALTLFGRA